MLKMIKKAFTLVELLVVIAILAALATVGIVSYSAYTRKANNASDSTIIAQLQHYTETYKTDNEVNVPSDVAAELNSHGFNINYLNCASDDHYYSFDLDKKNFEYLGAEDIEKIKSEGKQFRHLLFVQTAEAMNQAGFGYFLLNGFNATTLNVSSSLDVGGNTDIVTINYTNTTSVQKDVVIRTNGGTLNVNAYVNTNDKNIGDKVNHYDYADKVFINKVAQQSYHEHGTTAFVELKQGHIALEKGCDVDQMFFQANTEEEFKNLKVSYEDGVELPEFSRSQVAIPESGKLVVELEEKKTNDTSYIWLFKQGTFSQIIVTDNIPSDGKLTDNLGALKAGITVGVQNETEKTKKACDEIANIYKGSNYDGTTEAGNRIAQLDENYNIIPEQGKTLEQTLADETLFVDNGATSDAVQQLACFFDGGDGTMEHPWLIHDVPTMQKINRYYDEYHYYAVAIDKCAVDQNGNAIIDCTGMGNIELNGSFNGKGVKFINVCDTLFHSVGYQNEVRDITLENYEVTFAYANAHIHSLINGGTTTFKNIKVHGVFNSNSYHLGSFYNYGTTQYGDGCDYTVEFINAQSDAMLVNPYADPAGFIGHIYQGNGHTFTLKMDSASKFSGVMCCCGNYPSKIYVQASGTINYYLDGELTTLDNKYTGQKTTIEKINPTKEADGFYVAKAANATAIKFTVSPQLSAYDEDGNAITNLGGITSNIGEVELTNLAASNKLLGLINGVEIINDSAEYKYEVVEGVLKVYLANNNNYQTGTIRINVVQYMGNSIIATGTIDVAYRGNSTQVLANADANWTIK